MRQKPFLLTLSRDTRLHALNRADFSEFLCGFFFAVDSDSGEEFAHHVGSDFEQESENNSDFIPDDSDEIDDGGDWGTVDSVKCCDCVGFSCIMTGFTFNLVSKSYMFHELIHYSFPYLILLIIFVDLSTMMMLRLSVAHRRMQFPHFKFYLPSKISFSTTLTE